MSKVDNLVATVGGIDGVTVDRYTHNYDSTEGHSVTLHVEVEE